MVKLKCFEIQALIFPEYFDMSDPYVDPLSKNIGNYAR